MVVKPMATIAGLIVGRSSKTVTSLGGMQSK
jgi:hypothetical protein